MPGNVRLISAREARLSHLNNNADCKAFCVFISGGVMEIFPWMNDYCVGIGQFDQEHKRLVELTNQLYSGVIDGNVAVVTPQVIAGLEEYALNHMKHEEEVMASLNYPHRARHEAQHAWFGKCVRDFRQQCEDLRGSIGIIDVARELSAFLKNWLAGHMRGEDQELGNYLKSRGYH